MTSAALAARRQATRSQETSWVLPGSWSLASWKPSSFFLHGVRRPSEGGVACLSGTAFGAYGEGYLRFSYANSQENILEALRRVEKTVKDARLVSF